MNTTDNETQVRDYIASKGWHVLFEAKREIWLKMCPFCGAVSKDENHKHFSINLDSGTASCFHAGCEADAKKGNGFNLWSMKKRLGDIKDIGGVSSAQERIDREKRGRLIREAKGKLGLPRINAASDRLLNKLAASDKKHYRGLSPKTLARFKVGMEVNNGKPWLMIPYLDNGEPALIKKRSMKGEKAFRREPSGAPSLLFNSDGLANATGSHVVLCEAEIDAMSIEELGFGPAVASSAGAGTFEDLWREELERFDQIFIPYDNDEAGDAGAALVAESLGPYRCFRVRLPEHDVNECLTKLGDNAREAVAKAFKEAQPMGGSGMCHIVDAVDELLDDPVSEDAGVSTGWEDVDQMIGGVRPELVVISGDTGTGKTTVTNNLLSNLAKAGHACLNFSPEMTPKSIAKKQLSMFAGKSFYLMTREERLEARNGMLSLPLYICKSEGAIPLATVRNTIEAFIRRHKGRVVLIDHLDFILDQYVQDERREINRVMIEISGWPAKYGVTIILVAHPTKARQDQTTGKARRLVMNDIQGSSKIKQLAATILLLHRHGDWTVELQDEKVRWDGLRVKGGVKKDYSDKTMTFGDHKKRVSVRPIGGQDAAAGESAESVMADDYP